VYVVPLEVMEVEFDITVGSRGCDFPSLSKGGDTIVEVALDLKGLRPCAIEPIPKIVTNDQASLPLGTAILANSEGGSNFFTR
jgi:hypothetical protein